MPTHPDDLREKEDAESQLIEERDRAEEAADNLASIILGEPIDWSDHGAKWAEALETAQAERCAAQWYPVENVLPDEGKEVLLAWDYTKPHKAGVTYRTGAWWGHTRGWKMSGNIVPKIAPTHWREIPMLY